MINIVSYTRIVTKLVILYHEHLYKVNYSIMGDKYNQNYSLQYFCSNNIKVKSPLNQRKYRKIKPYPNFTQADPKD